MKNMWMGMRLSIMLLWTVSFSQPAALPSVGQSGLGFGALAMCLRASFSSPEILLMTVLSQEA